MSLYNKIIELQKLHEAWKQVYRNKPKEGVDFVSCEEFDENKKEELKKLWKELTDHTYECMPVRLVPIYKGEKVRYVSLYTMRDKVIQVSVAKELSQLFESSFSECCYSYRSGKSALHAAQKIHDKIMEMGDGYALRTDIHSFFDCILQERLLKRLRERISEEDVLKLIRCILRAPSLEKTGELTPKDRGIYQGAAIAPVLSNIYLMDMDMEIENKVAFYVRYSDDILMLFKTREEAEKYSGLLSLRLQELGLSLNTDKTEIVSFDEGFQFLGYKFDRQGRGIPEKAEDGLAERLETVWLENNGMVFEQRVEKCAEILAGWEQYFAGERDIHTIIEYIVWVYMEEKKGDADIRRMTELRRKLLNPYKDVMVYLAGVWEKYNYREGILREYEQYYELEQLDADVPTDMDNPLITELLNVYARYIVRESQDVRAELIQLYSDLRMYRKAELLTDLSKLKKDVNTSARYIQSEERPCEREELSSKEISRYMDLFVGREDIYAQDGLSEGNRRNTEEVLQPLLPEVVKKHLGLKETVSTYIQRSNGTVKYLVIDLDISKEIFLKHKEGAILQEYMSKCLSIAMEICKELRHMGLTGYLEYSGHRGYHIWIFFTEWLPTRYANMLSDIIEQKAGRTWRDSGIQVEYFPNKTRVRNGKRGQCLKLPWGIHPKTGELSYFLNSECRILEPQKSILEEVAQYSGNTVRRIISANRTDTVQEKGNIEIDKDISDFGPLSEETEVVLKSCSLLRYLCQKSRKTHYLNHFERLTVLYVFGHLGDEGKAFVHKVMSYTLNYSYNVTQKFILRCPEKPVSCVKLREQYKQISAETGCSCTFKRTKNCYPSPVLHALKKIGDNSQITIPVSRTLSQNKQTTMKEEISVVSRAQSVAQKMMELRKQRRAIDKTLKKYERELGEIYDDAKIDCMEIEMGLLVRKKNGGETEWVIEL